MGEARVMNNGRPLSEQELLAHFPGPRIVGDAESKQASALGLARILRDLAVLEQPFSAERHCQYGTYARCDLWLLDEEETNCD
jgi:hypothetical protein